MKLNKLINVLILSSFMVIVGFELSFAQEATNTDTSRKKTPAQKPSIRAVKISEPELISLDGKLEESIWQQAQVATGFTQRTPDDGDPATEKTEARILYTNDALYIGVRAYDSAMDSVAATLFRRDGSAYSDWFYVNIDSYNDSRTGFTFAVNPKGVRKDILIYDDNNEDTRWDAVWEAETSMDEQGWTAEMRIPLSQIRFNSDTEETSWGINFQRRIARKEEISFWSPTPQDASGFVSRYGRLEGIMDLEQPARLEIRPYVSSSVTRAPVQTGNPFFETNEFLGSVGGDIKYGLTSDLTLTATINPDFGQVEADPAVINLSAFETFFREQRPFFLEGNEIFNFGDTRTFNSFGNPLTFHSRRIGRSPRGSLSRYNEYNNGSIFNPDSAESRFTDPPDQTTIAAAAKLSGKTRSGWSVGFLDAYTVEETAPFVVDQGSVLGTTEGAFAVEPATNYLVARTKKDINDGDTFFGGFASAVNRRIDNSYFETFLHESAYLAGVDFEHSWNDRDWAISGTFSASQVNGTREAIERTQRSPTRYFNRVDSDKLSVDPTKTSLSGFATEVSIAKSGGEHLRTSLTYSEVSPGYETNDLGFQNRANYRALSYGIMYRETSPKFFRFYNLWTFGSRAWNYDGDQITHWYNAGAYFQFDNLWSFNFNLNYTGASFLDRLTRGGPIAERPRDWGFNVNINSDQTKTLSFNTGTFNRWDETDEFDHFFWAGIEIRPATNIQLSMFPEIGFERDTDQFVTSVEDPLASRTFGTRYVFADIDRTTFSSTIRADWTFTPEISLQLYARPFITTGNFKNYKEFEEPRTFNYQVYGKDTGTIALSDDTYTVDPDGNGPADSFSFSERDFNFRSIQGNTVFRWEYRPGAMLFIVWQHDRSSFGPQNDFVLGRDFGRLFGEEPTNVFLIKLSYWFGT